MVSKDVLVITYFEAVGKSGESPHLLACGLAPLPCRLPLKGGVIYGQEKGQPLNFGIDMK